jgi:acetyl-CoA/propionyl-CoA carboxylase biotin carboxyl carrier protein
VDEGYLTGMAVPGSFDSLVAKIIVTGADRAQAIGRARRALAETTLSGMPSVLPFHKAVLVDPAFVAADGVFGVHTRWIETEFVSTIEPYVGTMGETEPAETSTYVVEVNGRRLEVRLPSSLAAPVAKPTAAKRPTRRSTGGARAKAPSSNELSAPMQGTIVKVAVVNGDEVTEGDLVVVLEAMKMEQPITAHRSGIVANLAAAVGESVTSGQALLEIVDAG